MLYGNPNKIISEVGTKLMLDQRFAKLLYYADQEGYDYIDTDKLPDVEKPIEKLKNNKVFYNRRFNKTYKTADVCVYIRMGEFTLKGSKVLDKSYIEIGVVSHVKYLDTINGNRNLCLIDTIQKVIDNNMRYVGNLRFIRALPIRDLPVEYEGFNIILEITDYNENNFNR
ncbi:hypothetical protein [Fusobacterium sp.]|uniref:hypothetical protein n=1 Tax=Fusobacterium sp. TaxID=68766 RepID=UPI002633136C|nr:hypothetical protein [Fusobacterium sp.]